MVRNPIKKEEAQEEPAAPAPPVPINNENVQFVEREVNLSLLNDKLNYLTGLVHKIAEAAEIDLSK